MGIRVDDARQFDGIRGVGIDDTTGAQVPIVDGGTALGATGLPAVAKRYSDVVSEQVTLQSDAGVRLVTKVIEEDITLATDGTTTDSTANMLVAGAQIGLIHAEVLTTITSSATGWSVCDATTAARFLANTTDLTAGTKKTCMAHLNPAVATLAAGPTQAADAKLRITAAGGNPGAGKIRVTVFYTIVEKAA